MAKTIRIEYYGMEGAGETVTKAKQDAGRKIEAAIHGSYVPEIIGNLANGFAVLLYREAKFGWSYKLITPETTGTLYGSMATNNESKAVTERRARAHLADVLNDSSYIKHPDDLADWERKREWQDKYNAAIEAGYDSNEAHLVASGMEHLIAAK